MTRERGRARARTVGSVLLVAVVAVVAVTAFRLTRPEGDGETDRVAQTVSLAVSYPRQRDAAGLTRAVLDTAAARDGRLVVLAARDVPARGTDPALSWLTYRVHLHYEPAGFGLDFGSRDAYDVTACYRAGFQQPSSSALQVRRIDCPAGATPLPRPPAGSEPATNPNAGG